MRTGLWIPVEIEALPLSLTEKVLLAEIFSLDRVGECFASNEHFSKLLGIRPDSVSRIISKLKKIGYLKQTGFDGRHRKLAPIITTKNTSNLTSILSPVPTQKRDVPKGRVGESAEAAFAISHPPYKRVQLNNKLQNSWEDFLKWSRGRVSKTTWINLESCKDPKLLSGSGLIFWEKWKNNYISS